jgi:2-methylcitrate dehydratase PrpD
VNLTERLARFVQEASFDRLPSRAVETAKMGISDCVGVMLAGSREPAGRLVAEYARESGEARRCTVVGCRARASAAVAALANGTAAHALDYDDVNWSLIGHPSAVLVPTVLALGEDGDRPGRTVMEAYIAGFEVAAKLGRAAQPVHSSKGGWHATATLGAFGAAAAAAKLLGLSSDEICVAFGLTASMASGICHNFGTMTKPFHAGHAAHTGIMAARLAQLGLTARSDTFDDPRGFLGVYSRGLSADLPGALESLGHPLELETTGLLIKPYPCGVAAHPAVDGVLELARAPGVTPDQVSRIDVGVTQYTFDKLTYGLPETGLQGKFSMPYIVARTIIDRRLSLDAFTDAGVKEPEVRQLAERVHMAVDPVIEREWRGGDRPCKVTMMQRTGETRSVTVKISRGSPSRPLSREELKDKFEDCAARALNPESVEHAWAGLQRLETLSSIGPLLEALEA